MTSVPDDKLNDPVFVEIHEIETEIHAFMASLVRSGLTPEQRAIQVERFQEINREALTQLGRLKRQAASHEFKKNPENEAAAGSPPLQQPASERDPAPETEIQRVMRDLSKVDPETRSQYLETHLPTLNAMAKELSQHSITPTQNDTTPITLPQSTDSTHP
jgi:hypothetical protein